MEKSYVTIEQKVCPVCGTKFDTGSLILNKRLSKSFNREVVTGYDLCPEHQKQYEEGLLQLVVATCDNPRKTNLRIQDAYYEGKYFTISRDLASELFNIEISPDTPFAYIDTEVAQILEKVSTQAA